MKEVKRLKINDPIIDLIQAKYEDYRAKQDLLTMIFEIHKNDEDGQIVRSAPFKAYEKDFAESKIEYDEVMHLFNDQFIPKEFQDSKYNFEIDFSTKEAIIREG